MALRKIEGKQQYLRRVLKAPSEGRMSAWEIPNIYLTGPPWGNIDKSFQDKKQHVASPPTLFMLSVQHTQLKKKGMKSETRKNIVKIPQEFETHIIA